MASETKRTRRNTLERRCLGKAFKRLFVNAPKGVSKKPKSYIVFFAKPEVQS